MESKAARIGRYYGGRMGTHVNGGDSEDLSKSQGYRPVIRSGNLLNLTVTAGTSVGPGAIPVANKLAGAVAGVQVVSQYPVCTWA